MAQQLAFIDHTVDRALRDDSTLEHLLHRELSTTFLLLYLPNFAKATFSNHVVKLEMVLSHRYMSVRRS